VTTAFAPTRTPSSIFTHDVTTAISNNEGKQVLHERETIIFTNEGDRWIAIHEHLLPAV
jgi:hypothetical protein